MDIKFNDPFRSTEWLHRNFNHFSMNLPLDFSEILYTFQNYILFYISAHFVMWRHQISKSQTRRVKEFCLVPNCRHPKTKVFFKIVWSFVTRFRNCDSFKFFFRKLSWILKREEKHCNSEDIEDLRKVKGQIYCKIVQVSLKPFNSKK